MHRLVFAFFVLLAACSPAPPASRTSAAPSAPSAPPSAANADALTMQRAPAAGAWSAHADHSHFAAIFSDPQTGEIFAIHCSASNGALTLTLDRRLRGDGATTLRFITATRTLELAARDRFAGDAGAFVAEITDHAPEHDALITTLGTPGDRFAIDAGGVITVLPWTDAIGSTLIACR